MKFLMTISLYKPYVSGLTNHAASVAEHLAKKNGVKVYTTRYDKNLENYSVKNKVEVFRNNFLVKLSKGYIMPSYVINLYKQLSECDRVIINLPQFEGIIAAIYARILGKKLFVIYHCKVVLPGGFLNKVSEKLLNISNELTLYLSDEVITYTEDYGKKYLSKYSDKLHCNYPPIKPLKVSGRELKKIKKLIPKNIFAIGISARMSSEKGIEFLLNSIPKIEQKTGKRIKIIFAGPSNPIGEITYKETLDPLIKKYQDRLIFFGNLEKNELGAFYKSIDVLVLPSINSTEAFGIVQVEAMLLGVPVVASDMPGVRIPVKITGMGKLAKPKNSRDLADAISEVLINRNKYIKSDKQISKIFSEKESLNKYDRILLN